MASEQTLLLTEPATEAGAWTLLLNRPRRRNALTRDQLERIGGLVERAAAQGARALVVAGADGAFSAGMDFDELTGDGRDAWADQALAAIHATIADVELPVLAAVEGPCIGAGLDLALACDLVVAGADATFALPAARMGLLYRSEVVDALVRRLGPGGALGLLALGRQLDAAEARRQRLVDELVAAGAALRAAARLAAAAADAPREAVAATKRLVRELAAAPPEPERWRVLRELIDGSAERSAALERARRERGGMRHASTNDASGGMHAGDHA